MRANAVFLMLSLFALTGGRISMADTVAVLPGDGGFENSAYGSDITLGWGFTLSTSLTVTGLGYLDGNDGLTDAHPVGIWDSSGNLIAEGTVPSGGAAALVSGLRFVPITPVVFSPGAYTIGGYADSTSPDMFRWEVPSITAIAGLSFGPGHLYTMGSSLMEPTTVADVLTQDGYFGPDFMVGSATVVPEPRSMTMSLLGLALLIVARGWARDCSSARGATSTTKWKPTR